LIEQVKYKKRPVKCRNPLIGELVPCGIVLLIGKDLEAYPVTLMKRDLIAEG